MVVTNNLFTFVNIIASYYRQEKNLHYNFKTPPPAKTRNAGTSAGIFEHNPHFGFEIPSLKPITHNVLCSTLNKVLLMLPKVA